MEWVGHANGMATRDVCAHLSLRSTGQECLSRFVEDSSWLAKYLHSSRLPIAIGLSEALRERRTDQAWRLVSGQARASASEQNRGAPGNAERDRNVDQAEDRRLPPLGSFDGKQY